MNFDDLQKAWQSQDPGAKVNVDTLLDQVRRKRQEFERMILKRDVLEIGISYLAALFFSYRGLRLGDWAYYLMALGCGFVGTFMVVDRVLQRRKRPEKNECLKRCVETSLRQVEHQIWLLRNVIWWYIAPVFVPVVICSAYWIWWQPGPTSFLVSTLVGVFLYAVIGLTFWSVYRSNQKAVREELEPRRQELERLLTGLSEE